MPYDRNSELPEGVRDALPEAAQTIYRKTYSSAEAKDFSVVRCAVQAWGAVRNAGWVKRGDTWVKESDVAMNNESLRESDGLREASVVPTAPNEQGVSPDSVLLAAGQNRTRRRHYTPEFIKAHIDRFEGAFMHTDHPTPTEEKERPERSARTLAATVQNVRFDDGQQVAIGDIHYLPNAAGTDMRQTFSDEGVRERAGVSIYWPGKWRKRRVKMGEAGWVDVPLELLGEADKKFDVDFVVRPTAGGRVSAIREEDNPMPLEDVTIEELREANADLVTEIEEGAVAAAEEAATEEAKKTAEDEEQQQADDDAKKKTEEEQAAASESDRLDAIEKRERQADARDIVRDKLAEADLLPEGRKLVEADFDGAECEDAGQFGERVADRIEAVTGLIAKAAQGRRVTGAIAESDRPADKPKTREKLENAFGRQTPGEEG